MSITLYPTVSRGELGKHLNTERILLTASSFAADEVRKYGKVRGALPIPRLPDTVTERAADCGGFVATFKWNGVYPYTPDQYVTWLRSWHPDWAAPMDYCCEDEITNGRQGIVRERQQKTTEMAWYFWRQYQESWAWVPTIQGWEVEDYQRHATEMKPLIDEMQAAYGPKTGGDVLSILRTPADEERRSAALAAQCEQLRTDAGNDPGHSGLALALGRAILHAELYEKNELAHMAYQTRALLLGALLWRAEEKSR